jgi:protein ImuA
MSRDARRELLEDLRRQLRQIERAPRRAEGSPVVSTGVGALDRLLPDGGLGAGTLLEWLGDGEGSGAATLAVVLSGRLLQVRGGGAVVIDGPREFYPPAADALGIPLDRLVVVQPANTRDALWALEQSLRSAGVTAALSWVEELDDRSFRRLQLAAEAGGGVGMLVRPSRCRAGPLWAEARLEVQPQPVGGRPLPRGRRASGLPAVAASSRRRWRVELLHGRSGAGGEAIELELSHEADTVCLAAALADPAPGARAARA